MNIGGLRSIGFAILLVLLAGAGCNRPKRASSESSAAPTPQGVRASITAHAPDAFYDPPSDLSRQPGALLRSEPLKDVILPAGMRGWRILYATTVDDTTTATAVATVFAPTNPPAGPRPVVTWEHATTGLLQKCMPSLVSAPTEGIPGRDRIVMAGWVMVATDYSFAEKGGPHPYLIGEGEARAALDSVRAARQMSELTLDERMVVWGHSQGGHAALWTGIVGPRYAADLEILGVAAIALAAKFDGPALATSSNKALQARLEQNTADGPIQAPVVIAQGLSDIVVPPSATDAYVEERCSAGQRLEYWTFAGRDHFTIVQPGAPLEELLIRWTTARFANEPQASGCVRKFF